MKVTINVECTPGEARLFMGLPDVRPMQESLLKEMEEKMRENMQAMSPEAMLKTWLPATLHGAEQMQKIFFSQVQQVMSAAAGAAKDRPGGTESKKET
ncbi:MAG: DUF6489 family protein [Alphaproteobacteria bacterium]|nr:DUF6489 family protein [Alphaproteobacteria bacterium]